MSELTLWVDAFWISPYAFSCVVALEEKRLAYEVEEVGLHRGEHRAAEYAARALTGRVPMLRHGEFFLTESSAIVEYLDDAFPGTPRALPDDVRQRARARQLMAWFRSDLAAIREERPTYHLFYGPATTPLTPRAQAAARQLVSTAETLLPANASTLFGRFSVADSDLALMLSRLARSGHAIGPRLQAYVEGIWARPSVRLFVERQRPAYVAY